MAWATFDSKGPDMTGGNALLLTPVVVAGLLMALQDQYGWLGAALSAAALVAILWFESWRQKLREWRMQTPFDAYFVPMPHHSRDEWAHEFHVAAYSYVDVDLRIEPRLHHRQEEFIFGFDGDPHCPRPIKFLNRFIKVGKRREMSPANNRDHYISHKDRYHIKESVQRTKGNNFSLGFVVQTKAPGRYPVVIETITDCGEGKPRTPLVLVVDPKPKSRRSPKRQRPRSSR